MQLHIKRRRGCIICTQNAAYSASLAADSGNLMSEQLSDLDATPPIYEEFLESVPTPNEEVRTLRVRHFALESSSPSITETSKEHVIHVHHMNIRNDLMCAFTGDKV